MTTKITITLQSAVPIKPEFQLTCEDGQAVGLIVERSTDGAPFAEVARIPPGVFKWLERDLPEGHDYAYRMRPIGAVVAELPPTPPLIPPIVQPVVAPPVPSVPAPPTRTPAMRVP